MGIRSARLTDLFTVRALEASTTAQVLSSPYARHNAALTLLSSWQSMGQRSLTLVLRENGTRGFVQARARPGRESWDITLLACLAGDAREWDRGVDALIDRICAATAQRGAYRTFARVPSDERAGVFVERGFRVYATEQTLRGVLLGLAEAAPPPGPDVRVRYGHDTWDIFSLYCHIAPALVRHAEGRSLREWAQSRQQAAPLGRRSRPAHELVMGEPGNLLGWLRWTPRGKAQAQHLEILIRPDAVERLGELIRFGVRCCGLDPFAPSLCRIREYDGRVSATLEESGFEPVARETLLVRHVTAQVTERQLLIASLRSQGLGIDISRYRQGAEPAHQRLASSREAEHHYYDRDCRTSSYR